MKSLVVLMFLLSASLVCAQDFYKIQRFSVVQDLVLFAGLPADFEYPPLLVGDRIYVNATDLMRHLGGSIVWESEGKRVRIYANNFDLSKYILPPFDGMNYVPLRSTAMLFGYDVVWRNGHADVRLK